jgi:hypothetical protein
VESCSPGKVRPDAPPDLVCMCGWEGSGEGCHCFLQQELLGLSSAATSDGSSSCWEPYPQYLNLATCTGALVHSELVSPETLGPSDS